jgi:polysaccharide export outer membrane protein
MKYLNIAFASTLIFLVSTNLAYSQNSETIYTISSDDKISITVFNESDLSLDEVRIGANGVISMPLIGQVEVAGLNVTEIENKLTTLYLDGYLKSPKVSVGIVEYRPFYINGEVENPGGYPFRKGLTVEKAITIAGGFTERASKNNILLVPEADKQSSRKVNIGDQVKPGDVLTVNESFF